jgi:hypothetical protein
MKTVIATLFLLTVGVLTACKSPTVPEPPPTETKPAAGGESPASRR